VASVIIQYGLPDLAPDQLEFVSLRASAVNEIPLRSVPPIPGLKRRGTTLLVLGKIRNPFIGPTAVARDSGLSEKTVKNVLTGIYKALSITGDDKGKVDRLRARLDELEASKRDQMVPRFEKAGPNGPAEPYRRSA